MTAVTCASCRTPAAPNARFCHFCGWSYDRAYPDVSAPRAAAPPRLIDVGFLTAIRLGAGFAIGAALVGLIVGLAVAAFLSYFLIRT